MAVEPISDEEWHLFCGDTVRASGGTEWRAGSQARIPPSLTHVFLQVEILEGKDAGKQGKVVQVIRQRNWVVLEGLNTVSGERWAFSGSCPVTLHGEQPGEGGDEPQGQ